MRKTVQLTLCLVVQLLLLSATFQTSYAERQGFSKPARTNADKEKLTPQAAAFTITPENDPNNLLDALVEPGSGLTIKSVTLTGADSASGLYVDGPFSLADGIILASGAVTNALPPDESGGTTTDFGLEGCPECDSIIPGYVSYDAVKLEIVFDACDACSSVTFDFVFGSEEYPEYVGSSFNDVFGAYLNGTQVAFDSDGFPITINGPFFSSGAVQVPPGNGMEYDGSTAKLKTIATVTPGSTDNTLVFVVCDAGDHILDSGVLLAKLQGSSADTTVTGFPPEFVSPPDLNCGDTIYTMVGEEVSFDIEAADNGPNSDAVTLDVTGLPSGATMTPPLPMTGNPVASMFSWIPVSGQEGDYTVGFSAVDTLDGLSDFCQFTIVVEDTLEDTLECYPDLPDPELVVLGCAELYSGSDTGLYVRYRLNVLNYLEFPDELFEPAPDLPPCGLNDSASRTWVDVYDPEDNLLQRFCAFGSAADLNLTWFALPYGTPPPDSVYITLWDRRCDITYTSNKASTENTVLEAPEIDCPVTPLALVIPGPGTACLALDIAGADSVISIGGVPSTWAGGSLCFEADTGGVYSFTVTAINNCGETTCDIVVDVTVGDEDDITPTNEWINVFCGIPVLNGEPLEPGDIIRAYDPDGVLCGIDTVRPDGSYGFMPIYAEEPFNPGDQGAEPGDTITFTINGEEVFTDQDVIWTANGDGFELCNFYTCRFCNLVPGWNLVSWNRDYAAGIEEFMELLGDDAECVEVILGFDQGAMTYDPEMAEYSTLDYVDYHFGYWVLLDCEVDLEICGGAIPTDEYIHVYSGWNLVSYWPNVVLPTETALESVLDYVAVALGYDGEGLTYIPGEEPFNTLTEMGPCYGYWIKSTADVPLLYPGWTGPPVARLAPTADRTTDVPPSPTWVSLYGSGITVDSAPLADNSLIEAYTAKGVLCGQGHYVDGMLKFTPVYGHNETGEITSTYPKAGQEITLRVNGEVVSPNVTWTENGDRIRISRLHTGEGAQLPTEYGLSQNYPNPFNPATEISFSIPTSGHVELTVFNILGQEVNRLVDADLSAGDYSVTWNGNDAAGDQVSSGLYLYRLSSGDVTLTKKMILTK